MDQEGRKNDEKRRRGRSDLMRRPADGLDGGIVVEESVQGFTTVSDVPDEEGVVIAARSQLGAIRGPFESTDFLGVRRETGLVFAWRSNVVDLDRSVPTS